MFWAAHKSLGLEYGCFRGLIYTYFVNSIASIKYLTLKFCAGVAVHIDTDVLVMVQSISVKLEHVTIVLLTIDIGMLLTKILQLQPVIQCNDYKCELNLHGCRRTNVNDIYYQGTSST